MGCVYLITSLVSGRQYVGLTKGKAETRFSGHIRDAKRGKPTPLHRALRKHGVDNFKLETLFESDNRDELCACEVAAISLLGTRGPAGYNATGGGEAPIGVLNSRYGTTHSDHTKRLMRENNAMKNPIHRQKIQGANHPMFGKRHTTSARQKMRDTRVGRARVYNPELDCERSVSRSDVPLYVELGWINSRRPMSQKSRDKIRAAKVGARASEKTKAKMSAVHRAKSEARLGPMKRSINVLYQAGFVRSDVAAVLFLTPARVKALRRQQQPQPLKTVTLDNEPVGLIESKLNN